MISNFILSQVLIGIAFLFDIISFQLKKRQAILCCFIGASFLIGTHFILLENFTAGFLVYISTVRFTVAYFSTSQRWMYFFITLAIVALYVTYETPVNYLAFTGSVLASIASFQKNDRLLRIVMMLCTSLWIVHNTLVGSPAAIALESFFLLSNFIGYYRYYHRNEVST